MEDFLDYEDRDGIEITGIASKLQAKGEGTVEYHIKMNDGTDLAFQMTANYVPDLKF